MDSSFLLNDGGEVIVERKLPDEMLSWINQQIRQPKIEEQLSAIYNKVTCINYWMSLQMCCSLHQAEQQLWNTQLTPEQHVQFA